MGKAINAKRSKAQGRSERRGRPRRQGVKRHPSGNPVNSLYQDEDRGTDELRAKRMQIAGQDNISCDFPLDIAEAREIITERQAQAGWQFATLYWSCFGFPLGLGSIHRKLLSGVFGGGKKIDPGENGTEKQKAQFREAAETLSRLSAGMPRQMISLCCHFDGTLIRQEPDTCRRALSELDALFSKGRRRNRRVDHNIDRQAA